MLHSQALLPEKNVAEYLMTKTKFIKNLLFTLLFITISSVSFAGSNQFLIPKGNLLILAPPVINKDYFLLEFGFLTEKEIKPWNYKYNAYVTAALFQDSLDKEGHLKAGGLGFKGGVILPTQPWVPLYFTLTVGFAKTALHTNPFFGRDDESVSRRTMFLIESGALYRLDKYFLRFAYQVSNVKYFKRHAILTFGVSY